jgi:DtxR family Mn-dependent transcriptional regulator
MAGQKLAAHVLRRHRLVELFLVRIMGMDWSEVHQDAEVLEHAVSERLLERMDEMLERPQVDPHGDPIPTPTGKVAAQHYDNLLTCSVAAPLRVVRVTDQRAELLQLLERHQIMPGRRVRVESRDELTETLVVRPERGDPLQLGFRAAGRVMVEAA